MGTTHRENALNANFAKPVGVDYSQSFNQLLELIKGVSDNVKTLGEATHAIGQKVESFNDNMTFIEELRKRQMEKR